MIVVVYLLSYILYFGFYGGENRSSFLWSQKARILKECSLCYNLWFLFCVNCSGEGGFLEGRGHREETTNGWTISQGRLVINECQFLSRNCLLHLGGCQFFLLPVFEACLWRSSPLAASTGRDDKQQQQQQ